MDAPEFVKAYPLDLTEEEIHIGPQTPDIAQAQDYSYMFGRLMHGALSDNIENLPTEKEMIDYQYWAKDVPAMQSTILSGPDDELRAFNELNFHGLNRFMLRFWEPLVTGQWSPAARLQDIDTSQTLLAMGGFSMYSLREQKARELGGVHNFFEEPYKARYSALTGAIQEYDVALVLLDFIRSRPNLTLLPSPMQFERTNSRTNIDFTVADFVGKRAVGIQVKSNVRSTSVKRADHDRVIFVDGSVDLDNVRGLRTRRQSSKITVMPWPGIIAAKRLHDVKTHGKGSLRVPAWDKQFIMRQKGAARELVGTMRVDRRALAEKIGERILDKL